MNTDELLKEVVDYYLESGDFNGLPVSHILSSNKIKSEDLKEMILSLVIDEKLYVNFGDNHPNIHIKAFSDQQPKEQVDKFQIYNINNSCLYPTRSYMESYLDNNSFLDKPYSRELALGSGQLDFRVFDLSVLENYINDPRYYYDTDDIQANLGVTEEYYISDKFKEDDKMSLRFGFAYDNDLNRYVAALLVDMNKLSSIQQQMWRAKELNGDYMLHPNYLKSILGDWDLEGVSIFTAFLEEMRVINQMASATGKPKLFRTTYQYDRPRDFSFLIRPTLSQYNDFMLLLDKMMSDNLNRKFFKSDIELVEEKERDDGKIEVVNKGTIRLLEEWINKYVVTKDDGVVDHIIKTFKMVRNKRQKPAHAIKEDVFDQVYFKKQREIMLEAYVALRYIRLIYANHPKVKEANIKISDYLYEGKIWDI